MKVRFKVNGQQRTVDVPFDMPLLWALRDVLELKGTKGSQVFYCSQLPGT